MKGAAVMFTRKCSKFMQSKQASAFSAAASSFCANLFRLMLGAALLASILFVLRLHILGVLVVVITISALRIMESSPKKPESLA